MARRPNEQAQFHRGRCAESVDRPVDCGAVAIARQRQQVIATSDGLGRQPRERDVEWIPGCFCPAEIDQKTQVSVSVRLCFTEAQRCGQIQRGALALPLRVLGGHTGDLTRSGEIRCRGAIAARVHGGVGRHTHVIIDDQPALFGGEVETGDDRVRSHADTPDQ